MSSKKILISILIFLSIFVSVVAYFGLSQYSSIVVKPNSDPNTPPSPTRDPNQPFSVLLLGYGGENHDGGSLTDTIMLAQISPNLKKIKLISLPRDLWVEVPVGTPKPFFTKINATFSIGGDTNKYPNLPAEYTGSAGGGQLLKKIVSDVTGITPDYFISVDFSGFTNVVDLLGGVDVYVEKSFVDKMYPLPDKKEDTCGKTPEEVKLITQNFKGLKLEEQFPCRYETLEFKKGLTHMDGVTALKYVRSRHSSTDGGDFNRSARQRQLLLAVKDKVVSLNFFTKAIPLFNTLTSHVRTDINIPQLEKFISSGIEMSSYQIESIALSGENVLIDSWSPDKQMILIPKQGIGKYDQIRLFLSN